MGIIGWKWGQRRVQNRRSNGSSLTPIPQSWMTMEPFEIIPVETTTVACDGGDGPLGHPRVYLNLGTEGEVECPYCSRKYVLKEGAHATAH